VLGYGRKQGGHGSPKFLAYLVILCFERWCPKQNPVACLKAKGSPPKTFWGGCATVFGRTLNLELKLKRLGCLQGNKH